MGGVSGGVGELVGEMKRLLVRGVSGGVGELVGEHKCGGC